MAGLLLLLAAWGQGEAAAREGFPMIPIVTAGVVERWGVFELALAGPSEGNPFVDVTLTAEFQQGEQRLAVDGFYDGDGAYRIRFSPPAEGQWRYRTASNVAALDGQTGVVECGPPAPGNHGPVRVTDTWYLSYADSTPYFQVGTTCYAWTHQPEALQEQTLATLASSPFNKLRMCVFPKGYKYNRNEPPHYPYQGQPLKQWDLTRFNPEFWRSFERRVAQLAAMGIEADLILFHPYDRWGYADFGAPDDERYLRYCVARLAAFRNVWWSFANEFDLMKTKTEADWDRYFQVVQRHDPYDRLRGIHNCRGFYDHTKPWVTHCSIQSSDFTKMEAWRTTYRKPVLFDECRYEGDVPEGWGNIDAREMTRRFWLGAMGGCYVGHGETYQHPEDILWWSKGGQLHGESPARIAFFREVMTSGPDFAELRPLPAPAPRVHLLAQSDRPHLVYFDSPATVEIDLPGEVAYKVDGVDTWAMTTVPLGTAEPGRRRFEAPLAGYLLRLTPYAPGEARRPEAVAVVEPVGGTAPVTVRFSGPADVACAWEFGDGQTATGAVVEHTYQAPGLYTARLTVTAAGGSASSYLLVPVEDDPSRPLVTVGMPGQPDHPATTLQGEVAALAEGGYRLAEGEPWRWISVGAEPLAGLEGLKSFTVMGWLRAESLTVGSGGNRIVFNLQYDHSGFDLVHHADGRFRLAVNEWPDRAVNDSSPGRLRVGEWLFVAVSYDGTQSRDNVQWHFGGVGQPATLDRTTSYGRGPVTAGSGPLAVGNFNVTLHRAGLDRQFRGTIRGLQIYGSRVGAGGVVGLPAVREQQAATQP